MELSVVVNFYNMRREAERTLHSLSRAYQLDVADLDYEVLCIDNGSNPPLEADWVASFGPQFRLIRPEQVRPSPVFALNAAAREAKGRFLAVMIDGAHVLTPGVLREAMASLRNDPDLPVGVKSWFVGGDQRWLSKIGHTREHEDRLFEKIDWPNDGYGLFKISAPYDAHEMHWVRGMFESNCLFLSADMYGRMEGFDEGFDEPGAGFANLDLFNRALEASEGGIVALIGEASFHQFHGGTTTNVTDNEKDRRVNEYRVKYARLRGEPYAGPREYRQRVRGHSDQFQAFRAMRRPDFPAAMALTDEIRPRGVAQVLEKGSRDHILSLFAEVRSARTNWLGAAIDLYPADLVALQEVIVRTRPIRVVLANAEVGLIGFVDSIIAMAGIKGALLIRAGAALGETPRTSTPMATAPGPLAGATTQRQVRELVGAAETTLVIYAPKEPSEVNARTLLAYSGLVGHRCYMVVLQTLRGQPWLGYSKLMIRRNVRKLLPMDPGLLIDTSWDRNLISSCPDGFLLRVGSGAVADSSADETAEA